MNFEQKNNKIYIREDIINKKIIPILIIIILLAFFTLNKTGEAKIGERAKYISFGEFKVYLTVIEAKENPPCNPENLDSEYRYVAVNILVENQTKESDWDLCIRDFKLISSNSRTYEPLDNLAQVCSKLYPLFPTNVNYIDINSSVSGWLIFRVKEDSKNLKFVYHPRFHHLDLLNYLRIKDIVVRLQFSAYTSHNVVSPKSSSQESLSNSDMQEFYRRIGDFGIEIKLTDETPTLTEEEAIEIAKKDVGQQIGNEVESITAMYVKFTNHSGWENSPALILPRSKCATLWSWLHV